VKALWILPAVTALWVGVLVWAVASNAQYERKHPCIRSHTEKGFYQPPDIQVKVGEDMWISVPQVGFEVENEVCDEREGVIVIGDRKEEGK
jgi:hypothetical protein